MKCPACQTSTLPGQKFCGACGHKLESECSQCGALNPPENKFCSTCGSCLAVDGALTLARSGLINHADQKTADLLGLKKSDLVGKPFSLFVDRVDMVVFFSHWNELLGRAKNQTFELALKHKDHQAVYVSIECRVTNRASGNDSDYLIILNEVTEDRLVSTQLQYQQDLIGLIFTTTDNIHSVTPDHFDIALADALKKLCLFTKADRSFIYHVNRSDRCLELAYQWCQPSSALPDAHTAPTRIPLRKTKRAMVRFLQEQAYIVTDTSKLPTVEREELLNWHQAEFGAVMCHLIHSGNQPIGIIGVSKKSAEDAWSPDGIALVKFLGQMVSDKLPIAATEVDAVEAPTTAPVTAELPKKTLLFEPTEKETRPAERTAKHDAAPQEVFTKRAQNQPRSKPRNLVDMSRPMLLEKVSDAQPEDPQTVFPRDDGVVMLTCPKCAHQESVLMGWFEKLGNAISVTCPCKKQFTAILEKRRAHRKTVKLNGFFSLNNPMQNQAGQESIWGPIVVCDLSKSGLRFSTENSNLVHIGDHLMVRFNLDNSNQALIHKPAKVITVNGNEVGCQFEGDDSYDITLGFYFL